MATTKIWPVRDSLKRVIDYASNPEKTSEADLASVIRYAMNGDKTAADNAGETEKACYVTGVNCSADTALDEMINTQKLFGKAGGNVAYHCYQSFKPGEVTPEQCHQLGVELARRMWGDRYQVLVATHLDRDHLHNHLVCCSVSFIDGRKFNDNKAAYSRLRRLSDEICRENGLSVIEKPRGKAPRQIHFAEKNGEPTRYNLMREAISLMKQQGYIISYSYSRKYPTIRSVNSKKAVRLYRLGEDYELYRIVQRVNANEYEIVAVNREKHLMTMKPPKHTRVHVNGTKKTARKVGGLYGLYLHYLYLLGYRPKKKHRPLSPEMREAGRMCDKYSACARLMAREHLRTVEDVNAFISDSEHKMEELSEARNKIRNKLRRASEPDQIEQLKAERDSLTADIGKLRKDIRTAEFTLERSQQVQKNIEIELNACGMTRSRNHRDRDGR